MLRPMVCTPGSLVVRRAVAVAVSALAVVGLGAVAAPGASAAPAGDRYVSFGDSYTAGPSYNPTGECPRLPYRWTAQLAQQWGVSGSFHDSSCSGAALDSANMITFRTQLDEAAAAGALGADTAIVTLQLGGNEHYGRAGRSAAWSTGLCLVDFVDGCNDPSDPEAVDVHDVTAQALATRLVAGDSGNVVARIRGLAPNARIALVGYPTVLPDTPSVCLPVNGIEYPDFQPRAQYAHAMFAAIESAQRGAAEQLGLEFWSLKEATVGHDMCQPLGVRWITRAGDFQDELLPFHPTNTGYHAQATALRGRWVP